jgi:hypothetical protein
MRINAKMVELLAGKLPGLHVCHRNGYYAIDNAAQNECYQCGLSTRECYLVLRGMQDGIKIGGTPKQWGEPGYED